MAKAYGEMTNPLRKSVTCHIWQGAHLGEDDERLELILIVLRLAQPVDDHPGVGHTVEGEQEAHVDEQVAWRCGVNRKHMLTSR